jgi:hypothetical protein
VFVNVLGVGFVWGYFVSKEPIPFWFALWVTVVVLHNVLLRILSVLEDRE